MDTITEYDLNAPPEKTMWMRLTYPDLLYSNQYLDVLQARFQHRDSGRYYIVEWKDEYARTPNPRSAGGFDRERVSQEITKVTEVFKTQQLVEVFV